MGFAWASRGICRVWAVYMGGECVVLAATGPPDAARTTHHTSNNKRRYRGWQQRQQQGGQTHQPQAPTSEDELQDECQADQTCGRKHGVKSTRDVVIKQKHHSGRVEAPGLSWNQAARMVGLPAYADQEEEDSEEEEDTDEQPPQATAAAIPPDSKEATEARRIMLMPQSGGLESRCMDGSSGPSMVHPRKGLWGFPLYKTGYSLKQKVVVEQCGENMQASSLALKSKQVFLQLGGYAVAESMKQRASLT